MQGTITVMKSVESTFHFFTHKALSKNLVASLYSQQPFAYTRCNVRHVYMGIVYGWLAPEDIIEHKGKHHPVKSPSP